MALVAQSELVRYDNLYLSPHGDDAVLACAGRLRAERSRGERVLVLVLFESEPGQAGQTLADLGVDVCVAGLPPAGSRGGMTTYRSIAFERRAEDAEAFDGVMRILSDVGPRIRPRQLYVPLGVGGHIDHRLVHEASLQVLADEPGRNVFLYEERPEAFAPGAVRVRLGLMGARLPPGATQAAERAGLARYLFRVQSAPTFRGDLSGFAERFRTFGAAAGEWRSARVWNPQKAFGPRLQPIVHAGDPEAANEARELWSTVVPIRGNLRRRAGDRWRAAAAAYAQKLGTVDYAERYWLLLPSLPGSVEPARREEFTAVEAVR
jgi:LmbE family N-acetylglucosaminyl deacetylase